MRMVLGPEKEEVIGDCRKQHIEKVHDLYCSEGNILVINTEEAFLIYRGQKWSKTRMHSIPNSFSANIRQSEESERLEEKRNTVEQGRKIGRFELCG
jgi:hypothetical protein